MGAAGDLLLFTAIRYSFLACHLLPVSAYAFGAHNACVRWLVHSCRRVRFILLLLPLRPPSRAHACGSQTQHVKHIHRPRNAEAAGKDGAKTLRNRAKRLAKKNKIRRIRDQLTSNPSGEAFSIRKAVRWQHMGFRKKQQRLVVDNKPVPWCKTHEACRIYVESKQWTSHAAAQQSLDILEGRPQLRPQRQEEEDFTVLELEAPLDKRRPIELRARIKSLVSSCFWLTLRVKRCC